MSKKRNQRNYKSSAKVSKGNAVTSFFRKDSDLRNLVIIPLITGLIIAVLTPFAVRIIAPILNRFSDVPSLLVTQDHLISFTPFIARDPCHKDEYIAVIESGKYGTLSMNLTNNDERTMVVEKILFDLLEYHPTVEMNFELLTWNAENTDKIYYGVKVRTSCQDYQCDLLDDSEYFKFIDSRELPAEDSPDRITEHIEGKGCDSIDILISPDKPGRYRYKIKIFYSLGASENCVETKELSFISLDPNVCQQIEDSLYQMVMEHY